MAKAKLTSGMWRIDPQKVSRVIDRCGQPVASVGADVDSSGNASFTASVPAVIPAGLFITATATDPGGSTSEFSRCIAATGPPAGGTGPTGGWRWTRANPGRTLTKS